MTFPTIPTVAAGRVLNNVQANTTATRTFPALSGLTKNSGDLLIAIVVAYQTSTGTNAAFSGWTEGFTEFHDSASSTTMAIGMAYKWSTGSETGAPAVTQAGTITGHAAMFLLSIPGAHDTTPPEANGRTSGTTTAAASGALDPTGWAAEDTLWIEVGGCGETSTTGSFTGLAATNPTNYTDVVAGAISADVVGGVNAAVAFRQLNAASETPAALSNDTSNARWGAVTVAVRPAPVSLTPVSTTRATTWDVNETVSSSRATTWNVDSDKLTFSYAGTKFEANASVTTGSPTLDPATAVDDYTILVCSLNASGGVISPPAGYSNILASTNSDAASGSTSDALAIYYRKFVAGDTSTPAVTCTSGRLAVLPIRVQNADLTTFIEIAAAVTKTVTATTSVEAPSITTSVAVVMCYVLNGRSATNGVFITWTPAGGDTEIAEAGSQAAAATNASASFNTSTVTAGVASGTRTGTASATTTGAMGASFAIKEAGGTGTTPVSTTRATSWNVKATVAPTRVISWDVLLNLASSRVVSWDVRSGLVATKSTTWNVKAIIVDSAVVIWDTRALLTSGKSTTWDVLTGLSSPRVLTWDVLSTRSSARATTWDVLTGLSSIRVVIWDVLSTRSNTRATIWNVRFGLVVTRSTTWNVFSSLASVGNTRMTSWNVKAITVATKSTTWDVRSGLVVVRSATWDVLFGLVVVRSATWDVLFAVVTTRSTTWDVAGNAGPVSTSRIIVWNVKTTVVDSKFVTWDVLTTIGGTRSMIWNVLQVPSTGPTVAFFDGSLESPATIAIWDGSSEIQASVEIA